jgi:hypothetical protein
MTKPQGDETIIDIEAFAARNEKPPKALQYRIRVDKTVYVVPGPTISGRRILEISGHVPPEHWRLDERFRGGATKKIELTEEVDLTTQGIERFMTLPLDQTEGQQNVSD